MQQNLNVFVNKSFFLFLIFSICLNISAESKRILTILDAKDIFSLCSNSYNTYIIKHNLDLKGDTLFLPYNCVLEFDSGSIANGHIVYNETYIKGNYKISCTCSGTLKNKTITPQMYGAKGDGISNDYESFIATLSSGKDIICNGKYLLHSDYNPTIDTRISIVGSGYLYYDFHINCNQEVELKGLNLISKCNTPNGLFAIKNKGFFENVTFTTSDSICINGGISCFGRCLRVKNCSFIKSDINIVSADCSFEINESIFDCKYANLKTCLSNEAIHVQECKRGVISNCIFRNSHQDFIDLYFGAHNVKICKNTFENLSTIAIEIKAEYRDLDSPLGCNQIYENYTSNICVDNNIFKHVNTQILFWVGTREDERSILVEDGFYVRDVSITNNQIFVNIPKIDIVACRNVKGLEISNNNINSQGSVFLLRSMKDYEYEFMCDVLISNNHIHTCSNTILFYVEGCVYDFVLKDNDVFKSSNNDNYLILQTSNSKIYNGKIKNNYINRNAFILGSSKYPLNGKKFSIIKQKIQKCYLASLIENIKIQKCKIKELIIQKDSM